MDSLLPLCGPDDPERADLHLLLCPFAGGSASAFRAWRDLRPRGMRVSLAVYAGRDQRMKETCATSIDALADQVLAGIAAHGIERQRLLIAGHSMGAQVAYEVCARLERQGRAPAGLILSGCHAPHLRGRRLIGHLEDRAFLEGLAAIGGNARELLNEPGLWPVFMPMLRADFNATESYWRAPESAPAGRLRTPTLLVYGSADPEAWPAEVGAWEQWLLDPRGPVAIAGDHFYLTRRPRAFLEHVHHHFEADFAYAQMGAGK